MVVPKTKKVKRQVAFHKRIFEISKKNSSWSNPYGWTDPILKLAKSNKERESMIRSSLSRPTDPLVVKSQIFALNKNTQKLLIHKDRLAGLKRIKRPKLP